MEQFKCVPWLDGSEERTEDTLDPTGCSHITYDYEFRKSRSIHNFLDPNEFNPDGIYDDDDDKRERDVLEKRKALLAETKALALRVCKEIRNIPLEEYYKYKNTEKAKLIQERAHSLVYAFFNPKVTGVTTESSDGLESTEVEKKVPQQEAVVVEFLTAHDILYGLMPNFFYRVAPRYKSLHPSAVTQKRQKT